MTSGTFGVPAAGSFRRNTPTGYRTRTRVRLHMPTSVRRTDRIEGSADPGAQSHVGSVIESPRGVGRRRPGRPRIYWISPACWPLLSHHDDVLRAEPRIVDVVKQREVLRPVIHHVSLRDGRIAPVRPLSLMPVRSKAVFSSVIFSAALPRITEHSC